MPFSRQDQALFQNSLGNLTDQLQKWKRDKQAEAIYNELHPEAPIQAGEGQYGVGLRTKLGDDSLNRQLKNAQIQHLLRPGKPSYLDEQGFSPRQRQQHEEWQANQERLKTGEGTGKGQWEKLDKEVVAATNAPVSEWLQSSNHRMLNPDGGGNPNGPIFAADYVDDQGKRKVLKAPRSLYEKVLGRTMNPSFKGADVYKGSTSIPAPVQPKINGQPFAEPDLPVAEKPLDPGTAKAILQETGGDKNKARELARQRGYSF